MKVCESSPYVTIDHKANTKPCFTVTSKATYAFVFMTLPFIWQSPINIVAI